MHFRPGQQAGANVPLQARPELLHGSASVVAVAMPRKAHTITAKIMNDSCLIVGSKRAQRPNLIKSGLEP